MTRARPVSSTWWDWDVEADQLVFGHGIRDLLGEPLAGGPGSREAWRRRIHESDRERVEGTLSAAIEGGEVGWSATYRVYTTRGLVEVRDRAFFARGAGTVRAVGTLNEVRQEAPLAQDTASLMARIEESEHQFRTFVDSLATLAWTATPDGWIDFYNRRWYEYTGSTPEEMQGWGWVHVHDPEDLPRMLRVWRRSLETGEPWEDEFRLRSADGSMRWHLSRALPYRDASGHIVRWFGMNYDIHGQKLALEERAKLLENEHAARLEAEKANRAKDEFLAIVSHELRTPLSAVVGWTRLLRDGEVPPDRQQEALERIQRSAEKQAALVEDLLDFSRIASGKLELERVPTSLTRAVREAVDSARPVAESKGIELTFVDETGGAGVLGSAERLGQVADNLIGNALKFGARRVQARITEHEDRVELVVTDDGRGIAPELLPHIFTRFRQADSSSTRKHSGLGLGLAIVKHIVEAHDGEVLAASEGDERGARFTVRLPRLGSEPAVRAPTRRSRHVTKLRGIRVLAVDDDPSTRELLATMLTGAGATVTVVGSVAEALAALRAERVDVVVSDIAMPMVDGYALAERVRSHSDPDVSGVRLVALTAHASESDQARALDAGFERYLPKPVDLAALADTIASLARHRALDE